MELRITEYKVYFYYAFSFPVFKEYTCTCACVSFLPRTNLAGDSGGTQNITNVRRDSKAQGKIKMKV